MKLPNLPRPNLPFDLDALLQRRWVRVTAYSTFFVICFLLFAYWSFPYDRLRDYLIREVEYPEGPGGRRASGWELDVVELSPSWGTGVTLEGVRIAKRPERPSDTPVDMVIDELTVRTSPFTLLFGGTAISFYAEVAGGEIEGGYERSEEETVLETEIDSVELRQLQLVRSYLGVPLSGMLEGLIDLTVADDSEQTEGEIALSVQGFQVGDGKAKLKVEGMNEGLTVERIDAGDLEIRSQVQQGVARIDKFQSEGEDAQVRGSGTVRLVRPLEMSRLDMIIRLNFADSYRNENDRTRALFSLMEFNPKIRAARASDGALQWRLAGSFGGNIVPTPAGKANLSDK